MFSFPYANDINSLMYDLVCITPKIVHAVGVLRRYVLKQGKKHWTTVKRIFRYLCGTLDYAICYQGRPRLDRVMGTGIY